MKAVITEYKRPHGTRVPMTLNVSEETLKTFDAVRFAGFTYAYEDIGHGAGVFYISQDDEEVDVATAIFANATTAMIESAFEQFINKWTLDKLQHSLNMQLSALEEERFDDYDDALNEEPF